MTRRMPCAWRSRPDDLNTCLTHSRGSGYHGHRHSVPLRCALQAALSEDSPEAAAATDAAKEGQEAGVVRDGQEAAAAAAPAPAVTEDGALPGLPASAIAIYDAVRKTATSHQMCLVTKQPQSHQHS